MKLVNTSSKVISIGETLLMPDKEIVVTKDVAELPAVKAFVEAGFISIDNSDEQAKEDAEAKAKAEAEEKAKAEAEAKAKAAEKKAAEDAKKKADAEAKAVAKASK